MKTNSQHDRYKEFSVQICHGNGANQEKSILKMVLFKNKFKLRNHAVKHFLDADEFEKVWKKFLPDKIGSLEKHITDLKNMGCQYLFNPPCKKCPNFKQCTPYVSEIENMYLKGIEEAITQGGNVPRYVVFSSNKINKVVSILSNNKIILKAGRLEKDIFNLMTCYVKTVRRPFAEIRNNEISKILFDSDNRSIKWCHTAKWGRIVSIKDKSKTKKQFPKIPYNRAGREDWQKKLAEMKDW